MLGKQQKKNLTSRDKKGTYYRSYLLPGEKHLLFFTKAINVAFRKVNFAFFVVNVRDISYEMLDILICSLTKRLSLN